MEIISAMTGVFNAIFTWIISAITDVLAVFWVPATESTSGHLTMLGVLAVVGLAISIFFLIMGLVQNFLHLRG